jgi:hypothetical protein
MITPRHYEEEIREILTEVPKEQRDQRLMQLMMDVLDTLGYEYGNRLLREDENNG